MLHCVTAALAMGALLCYNTGKPSHWATMTNTDRTVSLVLRTLLPFGVLFGIISAGVSMNNQSRELFEQCRDRGASADACALRIYGR